LSKNNQIKQLNIKVASDVVSVAHLILIIVSSLSFTKIIIKAPIIGRKIVKERIGHSIMLFIKEPS
tara:strand:- start:437 stop:634 length:198 start_codon:yes stop_codon:yes gene_type:complete